MVKLSLLIYPKTRIAMEVIVLLFSSINSSVCSLHRHGGANYLPVRLGWTRTTREHPSHRRPPASLAFLSDSAGGRGRVARRPADSLRNVEWRSTVCARRPVLRITNADGWNMEEGPTAECLLLGLGENPGSLAQRPRCVRQNA